MAERQSMIVCVVPGGITPVTVSPLGVCVCVGREASQARHKAKSHKPTTTHGDVVPQSSM